MRNKLFQPSLFAGLLIASVPLLAGCGSALSAGNSQSQSDPPDPPSGIVVSVSPATASVQVGFSVQFSASVRNDSNGKGVTWSVAAGGGGNCNDCGTIDTSGKYTASLTVHDAPGLYVIATSVSDPTKTGTAVVFVTPAPGGIAVSPTSAVVQNNGVQQFTATGDPFGTIPVVTWSVSGSGCSGVSCGTIDSGGRYVAPAISPAPPTVMVTATSVIDSSKSGSARVLIGSNSDNSKLNGRYAFILGGYDGDGNVALAGSFTADGNGNITGGVADFNFSSAIFVATNLNFTGTYSVSSDNLASMSLSASGTSVFTSGFNQSFSFALASFNGGVASRGRIIELDGEEIWATGVLAKQDPAAFSTAAITGGYAFSLAGTAGSGFPMTVIGRFSSTNGSFTAGQADVYGLGLTESGVGTVSAGLDLPFGGVYQVSANGRGTAVLTFTSQDPGFSKFSIYVISAQELIFIEVDTCGAGECTFKGGISGEAFQQTGGPFSVASLDGSSVFNSIAAGAGTGASGGVAIGQETFDGMGSLVGTKYENNAGIVAAGTSFSGQYSLDANGLGRGIIALSGDQHPKPFYMVSPGKGFVIDSGSYVAGEFESQSGGPFGKQSISGAYAVGTLPWDFNWVFSPSCGVMMTDGSGNLTGITDGHSGTDQTLTGTYDVDASGKASLQITPQSGTPENWVFYLVSPSKAVGIDIDAGTPNSAIRIIEK